MRKLTFNSQDLHKFPYAVFFLMGLFYFIGLFTSDFSRISSLFPGMMSKNILTDQARYDYSMLPIYKLQWQFFSYHLIHFALVHYAYSSVLLFYYVQGLEKATNKKFIIIAYFFFATFWPIPMGLLFFWLIDHFPEMSNYVLSQGTYLGSSVGIWGLIGLSVPISHKRRLYWSGLVLLLIIEFALKLLANQDITSNIAHILIFLTTWSVSVVFIDFENNNHKVGELSPTDKADLLLILLITINALIMTIHFLFKLGYI